MWYSGGWSGSSIAVWYWYSVVVVMVILAVVKSVSRHRWWPATAVYQREYANHLFSPFSSNFPPGNCFYRPSFEVPDFVCSLPSYAGTKRCSDMPSRSSCWPSGPISGNFCQAEHHRLANSSFNNSYFKCSQDGPNPFFQTVSFDNIGFAWMVIFQVTISKHMGNVTYRWIHAYNPGPTQWTLSFYIYIYMER